MSFKSIKSKIIINIALIVFLGGLLTAFAIAWLSYNDSIDNTESELLIKNNLSSENINIYFENSSSLAKALSKNETILKILEEDIYNNPDNFSEFNDLDLSQENIEKTISETLKSYRLKEEYRDIIVTNNFGEIYLSENPNLIHDNISHTAYFKRAIAGYKAINAMYATDEGKTFYYIAEPIKNSNNQIIGTIVIEMRPEKINTLLSSNLLDNQRSFLIEENGIIVCSSNLQNLYSSLGKLNPSILNTITTEQRFPTKEISNYNYQEIQNIISLNIDSSENKLIKNNNNELLFTISPIGDTGFYNLLQTDLYIYKSLALKKASTAFIPTILTILIIIIFLFFIVSSLLEPIDSLKKTAISIGRGSFNLEKKIHTGDELEDLEDVIIKTSSQLKTAYSEMENKVRLRTIEIEKKNEQAEKANQAILNIMEDIENEKENVENLNQDLTKYKSALDNTSEQVIIADKEGVIIYANIGMKYLSGYSPEEAVGKTTAQLWRIIDDEKKEEEIWNLILNEKKPYTGEFKCKHKDGHIYFVHKNISPILNKDGEISFIISIAYDKTKEKQIDNAKTEFVSLASHQLRTPLSSINWYTEMLLAGDAGKLNDDQISFIKEISKGNKRMVDLVNSLLDVSRLELGTFTIEPEIIQVCDIAKSIVNELQHDIIKKKLKLKTVFTKNIPEISADPKLVRIIFQNLMSNAVKYTPTEKEIELNISKNTKNIIIKVKDNGLGIPKSQQDSVFTKLFRADNVKATDTEGTGLGLYLVKSILDSSGGNISFNSEENKGTEFIVKLPLSGMKKKEGSKSLGD